MDHQLYVNMTKAIKVSALLLVLTSARLLLKRAPNRVPPYPVNGASSSSSSDGRIRFRAPTPFSPDRDNGDLHVERDLAEDENGELIRVDGGDEVDGITQATPSRSDSPRSDELPHLDSEPSEAESDFSASSDGSFFGTATRNFKISFAQEFLQSALRRRSMPTLSSGMFSLGSHGSQQGIGPPTGRPDGSSAVSNSDGQIECADRRRSRGTTAKVDALRFDCKLPPMSKTFVEETFDFLHRTSVIW